ncbi:MAG: hypothetical protein CMP83_09385 [Gammaproteobacteria bacterium]|nr:hypothetical protein [Gammaproteobacteria bacterium]
MRDVVYMFDTRYQTARADGDYGGLLFRGARWWPASMRTRLTDGQQARLLECELATLARRGRRGDVSD